MAKDIVVYTSAPASYDYPSMITGSVDTVYLDSRGRTVRRVSFRLASDARYQSGRYGSGLYPAWSRSEFSRLAFGGRLARCSTGLGVPL